MKSHGVESSVPSIMESSNSPGKRAADLRPKVAEQRNNDRPMPKLLLTYWGTHSLMLLFLYFPIKKPLIFVALSLNWTNSLPSSPSPLGPTIPPAWMDLNSTSTSLVERGKEMGVYCLLFFPSICWRWDWKKLLLMPLLYILLLTIAAQTRPLESEDWNRQVSSYVDVYVGSIADILLFFWNNSIFGPKSISFCGGEKAEHITELGTNWKGQSSVDSQVLRKQCRPCKVQLLQLSWSASSVCVL